MNKQHKTNVNAAPESNDPGVAFRVQVGDRVVDTRDDPKRKRTGTVSSLWPITHAAIVAWGGRAGAIIEVSTVKLEHLQKINVLDQISDALSRAEQ